MWLKRALTQAAWGASMTRGSYFKAFYHRLAVRKGIREPLSQSHMHCCAQARRCFGLGEACPIYVRTISIAWTESP